ncbi:hypothetical protein J6590_083876 [Homalodisca vitripennis]|nr:hypothetical protein J6590_083876 [Homalodisca vitripennis]
MRAMGVRGVALDWFRSYLTGRTQRVKVGNSLSPPLPVTVGVPQGAVLSANLGVVKRAGGDVRYTRDFSMSIGSHQGDSTATRKILCERESVHVQYNNTMGDIPVVSCENKTQVKKLCTQF